MLSLRNRQLRHVTKQQISRLPGQGRIRSPSHPKTVRSHFIHHDFLQFEKQHLRYKVILLSIVLSQQWCEVYFIFLTVAKPLWVLTPNITKIAPLYLLAGTPLFPATRACLGARSQHNADGNHEVLQFTAKHRRRSANSPDKNNCFGNVFKEFCCVVLAICNMVSIRKLNHKRAKKLHENTGVYQCKQEYYLTSQRIYCTGKAMTETRKKRKEQNTSTSSCVWLPAKDVPCFYKFCWKFFGACPCVLCLPLICDMPSRNFWTSGHQNGACKDNVCRPRACSEKTINAIRFFI